MRWWKILPVLLIIPLFPACLTEQITSTARLDAGDNSVTIVELPVEIPDPEPTPLEKEPEPEEEPGGSPDPESEEEEEEAPQAGVECHDGNPNLGLLLVSSAAGTGLEINSNGSLDVSGGVVQVNRAGSQSVVMDSNSSLAAGKLISVGKVSRAKQADLLASAERGPVRADPFGNVASPTPEGLVRRAGEALEIGGNQEVTLHPGIYRGIRVKSNSEVTLRPGIYYLESGDLSLSSNSQMSGNGVRIILADGTLSVSSNSALRISALQDDSPWTLTGVWSRKAMTLALRSNAVLEVDGRIYLPNAFLSVRSNGDLAVASQVIANRLLVESHGAFNLEPGGFLPPCP